MELHTLVKNKRDDILRIAEKHGAHNVRVFGSVARATDDETSDVDLLVDFEKGRSLMDLAGLEIELKELLSRKVDVVTTGGLSPYLKDRILAEAKPL